MIIFGVWSCVRLAPRGRDDWLHVVAGNSSCHTIHTLLRGVTQTGIAPIHDPEYLTTR